MISTVRRKLTSTELKALISDFRRSPRQDLPFIIICSIICWIGFSIIAVLPSYIEQKVVWLTVVMMLIFSGGIGGYIVAVIRGERIRHRKEAEKIDAMREREYEAISAELTAGITFEGEEDLGPYWIGSDGESLLLLRSQYLYDMSTHQDETNLTLFDRARFTILRDPITDTIYRLRNQGKKIPVEVVSDDQLNKIYENLFFQHHIPSLAIVPGTLDKWQDDISNH